TWESSRVDRAVQAGIAGSTGVERFSEPGPSVPFVPLSSEENELSMGWFRKQGMIPVDSRAPDEDRAVSRAVVRIDRADIRKPHNLDRGFGSGVFVSADGLLLTGEHVLSGDHCDSRRCAGVRVIRDFRPGGEKQVFNDVRMVAYSDGLDFALLRVRLPE